MKSLYRFAELVVVVVAAACGGTVAVTPATPLPQLPAEPAPAPAPPPLDGPAIRSIAMLLRMEDERTLDATAIEPLFHDEHPEVRRRAALAAGRVGGPVAKPWLLGALDDDHARVVEGAVFALGELGDTSSAVVMALAEFLDHADRTTVARAEAAAALGKLASPPACAAVRGSLEASTTDGGRAPTPNPVITEALLATWKCPDARATADVLLPFAAHDDVEIRWRATYALMRIGASTGAATLIDLLDDSEPLVRALATRSFRAGFADSAGVRDAVRARLIRALADPDAHVRIQAINALASWAEPATAPTLLGKLDDDDANVRIAAAQALGGFASGDVPLRIRAVVEDPSAAVGLRSAALTSLARIDPRSAAVEAGRWAAADWLHRLLAVRAIGSVDWALAVPVLRRLAEDEDARVARAALAAVARSGDTTATTYTLYVQTLKSPDPEVRSAAIAGLGRRINPADLAALLDAYDAAQRDTVPAAALASVDALAALARSGVSAEHAFFARFRPHADARVRRRVMQRFPAEADPAWADTASAPRPVRDAAFYESIVRRYVAPELAGYSAPRLEIGTTHGTITVELMAAEAPLTVYNMVSLVESGFYASADPLVRRWHRVVPDFVLQDGDPRGDGSGGPRERIRDEINAARYVRGAVGMALSGPDTGGSQFFIVHSPQPHLDGGYTVFGRVVDGQDVADRVVQEDLILFMRISRS
ncbi:MAG: HEAT repeat domain-containing protein [Gemmatimonadetes bacterium]|nr:HEAT repeat domain-containing protein [Gemmatimonadota bacterium]